MDELIDEYLETIDTLNEVTGKLFKEYKPYLECHKGCSECCKNGALFDMRYIEGARLLQGYLQAPEEIKAHIRHQIKHLPKDSQQCPVLKDDACSLYEHRPSLCRAWGLHIRIDREKELDGHCKLNFTNKPDDVELYTVDIQEFYDPIDRLSDTLWKNQMVPLLESQGTPVEDPEHAPIMTIREMFEQFIEGGYG